MLMSGLLQAAEGKVPEVSKSGTAKIDPKSAQDQHDQIVAEYEKTMKKQKDALDSKNYFTSPKSLYAAQDAIAASRGTLVDSHANVLQSNYNGGLDMSTSRITQGEFGANEKTVTHEIKSTDTNTTITTNFDAQTGKTLSTETAVKDSAGKITTTVTDPNGNVIKTTTVVADLFNSKQKSGVDSVSSDKVAQPDSTVIRDQNGIGDLNKKYGTGVKTDPKIASDFTTELNGGKKPTTAQDVEAQKLIDNADTSQPNWFTKLVDAITDLFNNTRTVRTNTVDNYN